MHEAVRNGSTYDSVIRAAAHDASADDIYRSLAVEDAQAAADLLRPVYDGTDGRDGFVSIEISPHLAHDTSGTVGEVRALWARIDRANVLMKIPATVAGIAAMRTLVEEGINVNATLVFGRFRYGHAANAYVAGLSSRVARGLPVTRIASVVSLCVSSLDRALDPQLKKLAAQGSPMAAMLIGKVATAEATLTYAQYRERFDCNNAFAELADQCVWPQTLVWSNIACGRDRRPAARYIDPLVGPGAFVELPLATIDAYRARGRPNLHITQRHTEAEMILASLAALGLDVCDSELLLEAQELENRVSAYERLLDSIAEVRRQASIPPLDPGSDIEPGAMG